MKVEEVRAEYAALINPETMSGERQWKTMGDIAEVVGGGTPRTSDPGNFENGDIPWLTPADLSGYTEKYVSHGARFITRKGLESSSARILPAGSVLFTSRAPIGYVAIARNPIATNQGFKSFVLKEGILPEYVYWWLKGAKQIAESLASGTTFLELSGANAKKLPIPIVPIDQQKHIVAEIEKQFSRLDEAVANLKRVKANLKRYKAAVLKAAVEGRLVETEAERARREGRSFETGAQLLQRILETRRSQWQGKGKYKEPAAPDTTDLPELPEGWVWATVEQVSGLVEYGSSSKTNEDFTGIPVLRMGNIVEGELVLDELKYLPIKHDEFPKLLLMTGDLLFNRTNSPELVGKTAVFSGSPQKCSFASYLIRVRLAEGVASRFLAAYINSTHGRKWVKSVVTQQVGQANVNGTKLQALRIPVPPVTEQHRIVAEVERRLSILGETEAQVNANLQRAQSLRQAVLRKSLGV
ncbi:type-1 restriction enzyme EcoKI specificity protein [mine drainage metagenome]|uniref:Type-1 restriction enzyme EcoKI specificity protein n=1 Tax=mine drainage metagenome TaxID=410659 RepID=A0A1J5R3A9_9ZZZZ